MALSIRAATEEDIQILAKMNKHLIEDEGHRNPMSVPELAHRMRGWLQSGWNADIFVQANTQRDSIIVGYALYQYRKDEFFPDQPIVYLRQFLIERGHRGQGLGRLALGELVKARFPARCTVVVDVLTANERGLSFWQRVGFQPYQMTLKARLGVRDT
ncbi:MAG TPA: GNAT family N-acetyltransferase [bacterium]|nr:GNAT family N-acetyltransferase [bacterium]